MRLPWLQMDTNVFPRLDSLAGLLGIERAHAYGLAANLWMWAIDWGPSDAPPNGEVVSDRAAEILSAGVRWTGDPDVLVRALKDIGLIADIDGGVRVKGMDRYASAWAQQDKSKTKAAKWREQKRKWREANSGQVADKSRTSAGQTAKTETETETEKIKSLVTEVKPPSPSERIFEHWKTATGKPKAKADPKRLRLIQARLDEGYTEDDLRASIGWYAKSPFHCGENDRHKKYLGLDLMLRDAAHVDAGLDGPTKPTTVVKTTPDPLPEAYR